MRTKQAIVGQIMLSGIVRLEVVANDTSNSRKVAFKALVPACVSKKNRMHIFVVLLCCEKGHVAERWTASLWNRG